MGESITRGLRQVSDLLHCGSIQVVITIVKLNRREIYLENTHGKAGHYLFNADHSPLHLVSKI